MQINHPPPPPPPTHLKVIILCGDLVIIIFVAPRMLVVTIVTNAAVRCPIGGHCGRTSSSTATQAGSHGRHEQPEPTGVEAGAVAVHQDHGGGEVESTCGQDSIRRLAVERLAGHQPGRVVVVAWVRVETD